MNRQMKTRLTKAMTQMNPMHTRRPQTTKRNHQKERRQSIISIIMNTGRVVIIEGAKGFGESTG
jgi:hypothetical protein